MPPPGTLDDILDLSDYAPETPAAPTKDKTFLERLGGWRGAAGTAIRGLSGLGPGGVPGALLGGGGEALAELVEGSDFSPSRIGTEAAISAVPLGKFLKIGRPLESAIKGGVMGGVSMGARELAAGEDLDPRAIAESAGLAGLTGGAFSKLLNITKKPDVKLPKFEIETTTRPGGRTLGSKFPERGIGTLTGEVPIGAEPRPRLSKELPFKAPAELPTPYGAAEPAPYRSAAKAVVKAEGKSAKESSKLDDLFQTAVSKKNTGLDAEEARLQDQFSTALSNKAATATKEGSRLQDLFQTGLAKKTTEMDAADEIARVKQGLEQQPPTITETVAAPGQRMITKYAAPGRDEAAGELEELLTPTSKPVAPPKPVTEIPPVPADVPAPVSQATEALAPEAESPISQLTQLFKSRSAAAGKNYRLAKDAEVAGEIPTAQYARDARIREIQPKSEASAAGPSILPDAATREQDLADAAVQLTQQGKTIDPEKFEALRSFLKGESGEMSQELMLRLGLGAGGAALGAATDPLDNPLASAAAGGALGAAAPNIFAQLQKLGVPDDAADALAQGNGMSITERAKKIYEMLPQVQRFNYLADPFIPGTAIPAGGLMANAVAGPYGSAVMGALERGLAGDARGWSALQELMNPINYAKEYGKSVPEAVSLIGRAEGRPLSEAATTTEKLMAGPGTYMTAGDVAAKNILQRHGITPEEAQRMTLTAEPELTTPRRLAGLTKGSTLLQMLMPFSRTPANILEQGSMRIPILGEIVQSYRENPDPVKLRMVQQLLGLSVGAGSAVAGATIDPDSANIPRRYLTNMAGAYSLPAALGFAAGQSFQKDDSTLRGLTQEVERALPLPTTEPITEWGRALDQLLSGEEVSVPRGAYPAFLRNAPDFSPAAGAPAPAAPLDTGGDIEDFLDLSDIPRTR